MQRRDRSSTGKMERKVGHPRKLPEMLSLAPQLPRGRLQEDLMQATCPDLENGGLIPIDLAIKKGLTLRLPMTAETVDLQYASGRILAQTLTAKVPQPCFDYSAMDGYAVDVEDMDDSQPARLRLIGRITASRTEEEIPLKTRTAVGFSPERRSRPARMPSSPRKRSSARRTLSYSLAFRDAARTSGSAARTSRPATH